MSEVIYVRECTGAERIQTLEMSLKVCQQEIDLQFAESVNQLFEKFAKQTEQSEECIKTMERSHKEELNMLEIVIENYERMCSTGGENFD